MDEENKRSANQKIKELLLELNSNEVKRVEKALSALKVHGNKTVIRPLFEVLLISENEEISSQIWSFLHDLRDEKVIPEMMSCVLDEKYLSIRLNVLNSIWNSKIDYSAYLSDFVQLAIGGDFMTALECLTILENLEGPFEETQLLEAKLMLTETYIPTQEKDGQKKQLMSDIAVFVQQIQAMD